MSARIGRRRWKSLPRSNSGISAAGSRRATLLVFSDHCNDSEYIRREVTVAGESQKLVIPFRIENAHPKHGLRVRLADLHWIDGFVAREQAVDANLGVEHDHIDSGYRRTAHSRDRWRIAGALR